MVEKVTGMAMYILVTLTKSGRGAGEDRLSHWQIDTRSRLMGGANSVPIIRPLNITFVTTLVRNIGSDTPPEVAEATAALVESYFPELRVAF